MTSSYRIVPPLGACMRHGVKFFVTMTLAVAGAVLGVYLVSGDDFSLPPINRGMLWVLVVPVSMGLLLFVIGRIWPADISAAGLRASTIWGMRRTLPWDSITEIREESISGISMLLVKSSILRKEVWMMMIGVNESEVHARLLVTAGPDHLLTVWFAARRAQFEE